MFALADIARDRGDWTTAEALWRGIAAHAGPELRTEARFRLARMLADRCQRYADAGVLLRQILDEKPGATGVRLELARIDALLGRPAAAGRELRAAEAAGLPPEIEQAVRFYAAALDSRRRFGGNLAVALAPDSNVNRATASASLPTVLGNLSFNQDARAHSGVGLAAQGQGFARLPLSRQTVLVASLSGSANLYREAAYADLVVAPRFGPQLDRARDRLSLSVGPAWRWYGMAPYSFSLGADAEWQHAIGRRSQWRTSVAVSRVTNRLNPLQSGPSVVLAVALDHAFTPRLGAGIQLSGNRQAARDPGYATASVSTAIHAWREFGGITGSISFGYSHLVADARLPLLLARRRDDDFTATLTANLRKLRLGALAPLVRLRYERNASTVPLYEFRRLSSELGVAAAF